MPLLLFYFFRTTWISSTLAEVSIPISSVHVYLLIRLKIGLPYFDHLKGGQVMTVMTVLSTL